MDWIWNDVQERVQRAALFGAEQKAMLIETSVHGDFLARKYESPLEVVFEAWWLAFIDRYGMDVSLEAQHEVEIDGERFRIDFIVYKDVHPGSYGSQISTPWPKIAIELDGHDFHERTKEQVIYRNRRDRALQTAGWSVLHVSGSELYRDPITAVGDVLDHASKGWREFWSSYWSSVSAARQA